MMIYIWALLLSSLLIPTHNFFKQSYAYINERRVADRHMQDLARTQRRLLIGIVYINYTLIALQGSCYTGAVAQATSASKTMVRVQKSLVTALKNSHHVMNFSIAGIFERKATLSSYSRNISLCPKAVAGTLKWDDPDEVYTLIGPNYGLKIRHESGREFYWSYYNPEVLAL